MKVYKLVIEYDGTDFRGWQIQPNARTVQGVMEKAIEQLVGHHRFRFVGASRTDSGVHAEGQVASLRVDTLRMEPEQFHHALNQILPPDVFVKEFVEADPKFHARFQAIGKLYRYRVLVGRRSPIRRRFVWEYPYRPDVELLRSTASLLVGPHDFRAILVGEQKDATCTIHRSEWIQKDDELIYFIEGNRFLYLMVRILVATMLHMAVGKMPADTMHLILKAHQRPKILVAPPQGLTLVRVFYPE